MKHAVISGTGSYLPENQLTNIALEEKLDTSDEWIYSRTGIRSRHIAAPFETTSYMASQAAKQALESANIQAHDIDLILVATCTPDHFFPSMACHVQHALQIKKNTPAFDLGAACSGFVYALDVAKQYILAGSAKHVLVVGSESMSRAVDWSDRASCVLFGDGAGALVLSASDKQGIIGSVLHANYDEGKLLHYATYTTEGDRPYIGMRGNEVFKVAVNIMGDIVDEVLAVSGLERSDIKWFLRLA